MINKKNKLLLSCINNFTKELNDCGSFRKKRITKRLPGTFKTIQTHPKFKILTKNISVSHEDLVKEQEQEQKFKKNDVESIFKAPKFDRLGATPEK